MASIQQASVKTGVDFAYLVQQASAESGFRADAKAKTSSASGLYQFIESTWMDMMERHGAKHDIDTEGMSRSEALALRDDPRVASIMAAELAADNEKFLRTHYEGDIGSTELYFAHFLGAGNAAAFLNARDENGMKSAAVMLPKAAAANRNVFYDPNTGRARSLDEVYEFFDRKFQFENPEANRAKAVEIAAESYQNPFQEYPELRLHLVVRKSIPGFESLALEQFQRVMPNMQLGSYGNLIANNNELMFLTQMMELPFGGGQAKTAGRAKSESFGAYSDFQLSEALKLYKS
ncbi:MAG: transglycosylase SLT domain-containing protein [Pseudomonadota bacterium]